jgi:fructose-bisphosphate aldolase class II
MQTLRDTLKQAQENRVAIGHFNVADLDLLKAVFRAAHELKVPVIIGVSEGERKFIGVRQIAALVRVCAMNSIFPYFLTQIIPTPCRKL